MNRTTIQPIIIEPGAERRYVNQLLIQLDQDPDQRRPVKASISPHQGLRINLSDGEILEFTGLVARQSDETAKLMAEVLHQLGFGGPNPAGLFKIARYRRAAMHLDPTHPMRLE